MLSAIISTLSVTISGITFSILKHHRWAAFSFLFALVLAECLACVYIHDDSWLGMAFTCWALFLYYAMMNEWKAYKSHRPNSIYEDFTKIPQGVYYVKMTNGKFKTICEEDAQIFSKQGATIMQNELQPKATNKKKTDAPPWELPMDERIVNAICNMMRDPRHTLGYDPQTPLGKIARVVRCNWFFRKSNHPYPEWQNYYDVPPTKADATERGEILVKSVHGTYEICDINETLKRDDGSVELFNGDVYIKPLLWSRIVEPDTWNITKQPSIPLDELTGNRADTPNITRKIQ